MELIAHPMTLGLLTVFLGSLLAFAAARLRVNEDPRVDQVDAMLPHANCGACGSPGCRAFAERLVAGTAEPVACTVSGAADQAKIAAFLGVAVGAAIRRVAWLACAGGTHVARQRAAYRGLPSCRAAQEVSGAGKGCNQGCLGFGDCERACDFNAIAMNAFGLPEVLPGACVACGDCVRVCPRDLFTLESEDRRLRVACKNIEAGEDVLEECAVGCTACSKCAFDLPEVVRMDGTRNLPVVADLVSRPEHRRAIERCPTGAIVWMNEGGEFERGAGAFRILRKSPLPIGAHTQGN